MIRPAAAHTPSARTDDVIHVPAGADQVRQIETDAQNQSASVEHDALVTARRRPAVQHGDADGQRHSTAGQQPDDHQRDLVKNPTSYSYTWQDCNSSGASCTNIAGATSSSYTLQASDVGATIRSVVKATTLASATAQSAATTVVAGPPPPPSAPSNTATPTVSGTAQQGSSLTTTNGTWSNNLTSYSYTWQDCNSSGASCTNIAGATSSSYTLQASDVGATIRSVVKATNAGGSATAQSAATTVVAGPPPPPSAPSNTATPTVSGTAQQGSSLTTTNGTWSNNPTSYSYTWQDCNSSGASCTNIAGATSSSYTLQASDVGATIRSVVKATNAGGSATAQSTATAAITSSGGGGGGGTCNLNATPSNFASQVSAASASQTICLASGNYGTWSGTNKAITVMAASGASPTMQVDFGSGDKGFTMSGIGGMGGTITNGASNITITQSTFPDALVITDLSNANILLDHDNFNGQNEASGCNDQPGRVHLAYNNGSTPSGVTVQYSTLSTPRTASRTLETGSRPGRHGDQGQRVREHRRQRWLQPPGRDPGCERHRRGRRRQPVHQR